MELIVLLATFGNAIHYVEMIMDIYVLIKEALAWREFIMWWVVIMTILRLWEFKMIIKMYNQEEK